MLILMGQNLQHHPHIHYVVPAGGLAPDGTRWIPSSRRFFLPVAALSRIFRGKFAAGLKQLFLQHKLQFHGSLQSLADPHRFRQFLRQLFHQDWVVYASLTHSKAIVAVICLLLCGLGCSSVGAVADRHPDEMLFERSMDAVERKHFTAAHVSLETLINTYPGSEYADKERLAL
jgi:hypothetical protein